MGIPSVNNLYMMERALYGDMAGAYANCPSFINGYRGNTMNSIYNTASAYNPAFYGMNPYNRNYYDTFTSSANSSIFNQTQQQPAAYMNQFTTGVKDSWNTLADFYVKNSAPSEGIVGAAIGGAAFGLINNPRLVAHPINSISSLGAVEKMFAGVKDEKNVLYKLWKDGKGGQDILTEAYFRTHKLESLHNKKLGLFRRSLVSKKFPEGERIYQKYMKQMTDALKHGNVQEIATATEEIKRVTNAFTGAIPNGLRKVGLQKPMQWLRGKINKTHYEPLADVVAKNTAEYGVEKTFLKTMKHSCGFMNGLMFAGFEFLADFAFEKNIQAAFEKDKETGWKQVKQTAWKGIGSAVGWGVGEGIGAWAGAKIGASLGTAISPGLGTAIGAVAGLIGGSIGCWLTGKVVKKHIGEDVGAIAKAEKKARTAEGQAELLQFTLQKAQEKGGNIDPKVLMAIQNISSAYNMG